MPRLPCVVPPPPSRVERPRQSTNNVHMRARACVRICPSGRAYGLWAPGAKTDILVIEGGGLASAALRCSSASFASRAASAIYKQCAHARARMRAHMPKWPCLWAVGAGSQDGHFGYRRRGACLGCLALFLRLLRESSGLGNLQTMCTCARAHACAYAQVAVLMGCGRREPRRTFWL